MADNIGSTTGTAGFITVGGSTINTIEQSGDHDWFRVNLVAGQAITVTLNGITLVDPYLRILDANGNEIYYDDDIHPGVVLDSQISFAASTTGAYYIDVGAYDNSGAGDYQLTVAAFQPPTQVWTNDQIAQQLVSGYWGDGQHPFNVSSGGSLTVNITALNAAGQALARQALTIWSEITGITFNYTILANPNIRFTDNDPDGGAFTEGLTYSGQYVTTTLVNIDASWLTSDPNVGGYAFQAYLHEIGHALGLGHAGNYNDVATYPYDALYVNDSWATSVMSYFSQQESTYFANQGFDETYLITPMAADILAVQQLYGLSTTTRSGNNTYGFNSNAGNIYNAQQYSLATVAYTIFDTGGTDTLDYSGYSVAQRIDLNPEQFSNVGGQIGNVTIARGTIIENAIGGSGADVIIGNSVANVLTGRGGVDRLAGGTGSDTFQDTRSGLNGDTITDFAAGDRIVFTDATLAGFTFNLSGSTLTYSGGSLILIAPVVGTITASAATGGGVQLTMSAIADVRNDFNGDGRSDVLWRSDTGVLSEWLGQSGGTFAYNPNADYQVDIGWQIIGFGDFNGDTRDDILWRHQNGDIMEWLAQAGGAFAWNPVEPHALPTDWHLVGIADFNGDGRDDMMWRTDITGTLTEWLGQADGSFAANPNAQYILSPNWQVAGVGDFNGDGRDDILWRNEVGAMSEWLGQVGGTFAWNPSAAYQLPTNWIAAAAGDFNGDGRDDILWRNEAGAMAEWLGQVGGTFAYNPNAAYQLPANWEAAAAGDFNGDGRDDILWRNEVGAMAEWLGQVGGTFAWNPNAGYQLPTNWHAQPDALI